MTDTANVVAASPNVSGGVAIAPKGTALPTDATTALAGAFVRLGYVSEDGVVPADDAASVTDVRAWGGDIIARLLESKSVARYDFTLVEVLNEAVNEFVYGEDNVTVTAATTSAGTKLAIEDKGDEPEDCVLVFDMVYKAKRLRVVVPNASSVITGQNPFVHTGVGGFTVQTTCLADEDGVRQYKYLENDDKVPA